MAGRLTDTFNTTIRAATRRDLSGVMAIEDTRFLPEDRYPRRIMKRAIKDSKENPDLPFLVAVTDDGRIVGYAQGEIEKDGAGEVASIGVSPAHDGHGIGRQMLTALEEKLIAAGANRLTLQVQFDNAAALHLYESDGFKTTERLDDYYAPGRDAFEMVKPVPSAGGASARTPHPR